MEVFNHSRGLIDINHRESKDVLIPTEIFSELDQFVIGQYQAKKKLAIAAYNHVKRIRLPYNSNPLIKKSNVLLYGPTGSGKTHIARQLARIFEVPFLIVDATDFTEAGYYGKDVETIIGELLLNSESLEEAQRGIVFIDEIDKIATRSGEVKNGAGNRDIGGEGVQHALLKLLEGKIIYAPKNVTQHWNKHDFVAVDVSNILFICSGAFSDLSTGRLQRITGFENKTNLYFQKQFYNFKTKVNNNAYIFDHEILFRNHKNFNMRNPLSKSSKIARIEPFKESFSNSADIKDSIVKRSISVDEFQKYGLSPEFLGRLTVRIAMAELTSSELLRVLVEPPDALIKEYAALLMLDNIDLNWDKDAFIPVANYAFKLKLGARSLRSLIEEILEDLMFEAPGWKKKMFTITRQYVEKKLYQMKSLMVDNS